MRMYLIVLRGRGLDDRVVVDASTIDALLNNQGYSSARVLFLSEQPR